MRRVIEGGVILFVILLAAYSAVYVNKVNAPRTYPATQTMSSRYKVSLEFTDGSKDTVEVQSYRQPYLSNEGCVDVLTQIDTQARYCYVRKFQIIN